MNPFRRSSIEALKRKWRACWVSVLTLQFLTVLTASAQSESPLDRSVRSVSGQFIIRAAKSPFSPLYNRPEFATNNDYVRLKPALLAVSAERFKVALWRQLDINPAAGWRGKIYMNLHPALTPNDKVVIVSEPFLNAWNYRLELPDLVMRTRYARALAAVLLLEIANRHVPVSGHLAEIPAWLADGLAQTVLNENISDAILSQPFKTVNGYSLGDTRLTQFKLPENYLHENKRGLDPLADARALLQSHRALAFDDMSWPTDKQIYGGDGGIYLASAQLFVHELLDLKNGPQKMRALLAKLPHFYNWQTAFFAAFRDDFQSPLDVEKWWSLQVAEFGARGSGSQWTLAESRRQLAALLAVPVNVRSAASSLPQHKNISLQAALRSFSAAQRDAVMSAKLDDFDLTQLRFAPPYAALVAGYRAAIEDFLGGRGKRSTPAKNSVKVVRQPQPDLVKRPVQSVQPGKSQNFSPKTQAYLEQLQKKGRLGGIKPMTGSDLERRATELYSTRANFAGFRLDNSVGVSANKHRMVPMLKRASLKTTLKKLDALDIQRRELEARLDSNSASGKMAAVTP